MKIRTSKIIPAVIVTALLLGCNVEKPEEPAPKLPSEPVIKIEDNTATADTEAGTTGTIAEENAEALAEAAMRPLAISPSTTIAQAI